MTDELMLRLISQRLDGMINQSAFLRDRAVVRENYHEAYLESGKLAALNELDSFITELHESKDTHTSQDEEE